MSVDATRRRALLSRPAGIVATGFGAGLSPVAPGTVGSAVALLPWPLLRECSPIVYVAIVVAAFGVGVWASRSVIAALCVKDPALIVCDEFVGQWIALAPLVFVERGWPWIAAAFLLFRLFDIAKPWPISWADRTIEGGLGVMLDDVLAGIFAAATLAVAAVFF